MELLSGMVTPGGMTGLVCPYGDRPVEFASLFVTASSVASNVSVLLLARVDETSSAKVDATSAMSVSELDDDEGLPGTSEAEEMERS